MRASRHCFEFHWLLLVLLATSAGCARPAAEKEPETVRVVSIQAAPVRRVTLHPSLELVGVLIAIPERTSLITSQQGGWVEQVEVVDSQPVHQGDVLVRLDQRTARANLARAQAAVEEKQAALVRLKRGYLPQEIESARQERDRAQATMESLRVELTALQELLNRNELPLLQFETKQKAFKSAEAAFKSADERARLLEAGTRPELIQEAQAQLEAAQADREHADLAVQWCEIRSPRDGVVVQVQARQGQFVDRAIPLATVIDLSEVFVQLRIPGEDLAKIHQGTRVDLELPSYPKRTFQGAVWRLSSEADPLTGNVDAFAMMKNDAGILRPGLGCHARVQLPEIPEALVVPAEAISDHSGQAVVTVIRQGKAYEVHVTIGARTRELAQILEGLAAGDVVATVGGYGLPEGTPVQLAGHSSGGVTP